tara:strand:- start:26998 stop:27633 length:636 start_codon:yes stop_codon:yes gene_type:complete
MTEEEIQALQTERDEAIARAKEAEENDAKKVEEIKGLRTRAQEAEAERDEVKQKLTITKDPNEDGKDEPSLADAIQQELNRRDAESRKKNFEQAVEEFRKSKPEFQADDAGLVFDKFKKNMDNFNLSGVSTKEEAKAKLEEIYRFTNFKEGKVGDDQSPEYDGTPSGGGNPPADTERISQSDAAVIKETGMDPEKFKKLSEKYPDALSSLG